MRKTVAVVAFGTCLLFALQGASAEKEKTRKEKIQEEKLEETKRTEEQMRRTEDALKAGVQVQQMVDLQATVLQQQRMIQDTLSWIQFPRVGLTLDKEAYLPNEAIVPHFTVTNGSKKTYWIDGRLAKPVYEVRNAVGDVVFASQSPDYTLPQEKDLIEIAPGDALRFPDVTLRLRDPGRYTVRGTYIFFAPEEEEGRAIWAGTLSTFPVPFEVAPKESR